MATITVDWDLGFPYQLQEITLNDTSNTIIFDDPQESLAPLILRVEQGVGILAKTATWPSNVFWSAGVPPTLSITAGAVDVLEFIGRRVDSSTFEYYGSVFALGIL